MASLINTKWRKDAGENVADALIRTTGAGITALALKKMTSQDFTSKGNLYETVANLAPAAMSVLGIVGDLFFSEPKLRAFCQGMYTFGLLRTTSQFIAGSGAYMGIDGKSANTGVSGVPGIMNGIRPSIMNGAPATTYVTPRAAIAKTAATVRASADMNESKANALAGTMIQN